MWRVLWREFKAIPFDIYVVWCLLYDLEIFKEKPTMAAEKIGYATITNATPVTVKQGPAGFFGFTVTASTSASITVYDNTAASGTPLYSKTGLALGETVHFGGLGFAAKNGLHVVVGGTGTVNVLYT